MPAIRDSAITIYAAATANMVCEMPTHVTGDLLVAFVNKDTNSAFGTPAGWDLVQANVSTNAAGGVYAKRAASSSETVTFTLTSETCCACIVAVKNVYGTTRADAISNSAKSAAEDATVPLAGIGITPSYNNSLVLHGLSTDLGMGVSAYPGWVNIFVGDAGANSLCVSYTCQRTAAAITAPNHWAATQADSWGFIVAIRDDGNDTEVDPYIAPGTTPCTLITPFVYGTTAAIIAAQKGTWAAVANDIATVNSKTLTWVICAAAADSGYNPFRAASRIVAASSTANFGGCELRLTSAVDLTLLSGVIFGTVRPQLPRDYLDLGKASTGGLLIGIADAENDHKFWSIAAQFAKGTDPSNRQNYAIEVSTTDTDYVTSGTVGLSTINDIYCIAHGYYGAQSSEWSDLYLLNETVIAGGKSAYPLDLDDIVYVVNRGSGFIPLIQVAGSAATIWTALRFGGVDPINVNCNLNVFQYPRKADQINYFDFHVSNSKLGIEFYGLSGDTLIFTGCVFTSASPYYWKFNASHSAGATLTFTGTSVVNATVTLQSTVTLDGVTFIDCGTFTQNSAVLTNCAFDNTKITVTVPADAEDIDDCTFLSSGTGYAMEIGGTAANINLDGLIFTGYAASDGSTGNEAIYVNIATGSMTITIIGGGSTPSIRTAGCTVTVVNAVNLTITGLVTGSDIVVYTAGTETVLDSVQNNAGTTWVYDYPAGDAGDDIDVGVFLAGYRPFYIRAYELGATDASIPAAQQVDRDYLA